MCCILFLKQFTFMSLAAEVRTSDRREQEKIVHCQLSHVHRCMWQVSVMAFKSSDWLTRVCVQEEQFSCQAVIPFGEQNFQCEISYWQCFSA